MAESHCCPPETVTTLLISYPNIITKKGFKKSSLWQASNQTIHTTNLPPQLTPPNTSKSRIDIDDAKLMKTRTQSKSTITGRAGQENAVECQILNTFT